MLLRKRDSENGFRGMKQCASLTSGVTQYCNHFALQISSTNIT